MHSDDRDDFVRMRLISLNDFGFIVIFWSGNAQEYENQPL